MSTTDSPLDRLPPHSIEAERGVLGCLLMDPRECLPALEEKLQAGPSAFYDLRHADLCGVLLDMHRERSPIDGVTVADRLQSRGMMERVGGVEYALGHADTVPSAANFAFYLGILREKFALRRVLATCSATMGRIAEGGQEAEAAVAQFERDALAVRDSLSGASEDADIRGILRDLVDQWQAAADGKAKPPGVLTGLRELDRRTRGMRPGEIFVLAGRPGTGKSALAMNIAGNLTHARIPVGVISLEMTAPEIMTRAACSRAMVDARRAEDGALTREESTRLTVAMGQLAREPLHVNDIPGRTVAQIAAAARRWKQRQGIQLLVIDYIQLIRDGSRRRSRYESVSDTTAELKNLAKELAIPILELAQLNRASESDERPPRAADLRDSGSIEQDADVVWLLHPGEPDGHDLPVTVITPKVRRGPTGQGQLLFRRQFTRYEDQPISA